MLEAVRQNGDCPWLRAGALFCDLCHGSPYQLLERVNVKHGRPRYAREAYGRGVSRLSYEAIEATRIVVLEGLPPGVFGRGARGAVVGIRAVHDGEAFRGAAFESCPRLRAVRSRNHFQASRGASPPQHARSMPAGRAAAGFRLHILPCRSPRRGLNPGSAWEISDMLSRSVPGHTAPSTRAAPLREWARFLAGVAVFAPAARNGRAPAPSARRPAGGP